MDLSFGQCEMQFSFGASGSGWATGGRTSDVSQMIAGAAREWHQRSDKPTPWHSEEMGHNEGAKKAPARPETGNEWNETNKKFRSKKTVKKLGLPLRQSAGGVLAIEYLSTPEEDPLYNEISSADCYAGYCEYCDMCGLPEHKRLTARAFSMLAMEYVDAAYKGPDGLRWYRLRPEKKYYRQAA